VEGRGILSYMCEHETYFESHVAALMEQLLKALEHIHGLEIAHLDLEVSSFIIDNSSFIIIIIIVLALIVIYIFRLSSNPFWLVDLKLDPLIYK